MKPGYFYIFASKPMGVLYIGVTDDLAKRMEQHRSQSVSSFARKYNCHLLVWFEEFENIHDARAFERQMKKWNRAWKVNRIVEANPTWHDLAQAL